MLRQWIKNIQSYSYLIQQGQMMSLVIFLVSNTACDCGYCHLTLIIVLWEFKSEKNHKIVTHIYSSFVHVDCNISPLSGRLRRTRTVCYFFCCSWDSFPWLPTGFWTCLPPLSTSPSPFSSAQSSLVSTQRSPAWRLVSEWFIDTPSLQFIKKTTLGLGLVAWYLVRPAIFSR